ncbi:hypothetical protein JCM15765_13800 [Paradesulfitobacterium aromaticivorans]
MAKSVCILVRRAPYGVIQAAEAVRHINGAVANGFAATAVFADDGIYVLKVGQDAGNTSFTSLGGALNDTLAKPEPRAQILVHRTSAEARGLGEDDLISGVTWISDSELAELMAETPNVMLF